MHPVGPSPYFRNLFQQPEELLTDFLACVSEAVEWRVDPGPTREMLVGVGRAYCPHPQCGRSGLQ